MKKKRTVAQRRRIEYLGGVNIAIFGVLIACIFVVSGAQQFILRSSSVAAVASTVLIDLANEDRTTAGIGELKVNPVLVEAAQAKANDMAVKGYFAHVSPEGVDPWHWFQEAGYTLDYAGENLAIDFSDSGDVNTAWMNSPTHRDNLLDPHYTEIGIAIAQGMYQGRMTTFVVQEFGAPSSHAVVSSQVLPASASVPTNPEVIATARSSSQVLGSATIESKQAIMPNPIATTNSPEEHTPRTVVTTDPHAAAQLSAATMQSPPLWRYAIGFPRDTLRYAYYALAALVLLTLSVDTGLEIRWHHRRKALRASVLLAGMTCLFFAANFFFFAPPVLAAVH